MANVFLGSVGDAYVYNKDRLFFTATTLTDSSINTGVSAEEVRGGTGAKLLANFFHTTSFGLTMTDSMFNIDYIAAEVGDMEERSGGNDLEAEKFQATSNNLEKELTKKAVAIVEGGKILALVRKVGETNWETKEVSADNKVTVDGAGTYCIKYWYNNELARKIIVKADFVPAELTVMLTTNLYAGDASAKGTGKPIGKITIKIPRFQLNGTFDLAMAMASPATFQIQGSALAYGEGCDASYYAEIVQIIDNQTASEAGFTDLYVDGDTAIVGKAPMTFLVGPNKIPTQVSNDDVTFNPALDATSGATKGTFKTAGACTLTLKKDPKITGAVNVVTAGA